MFESTLTPSKAIKYYPDLLNEGGCRSVNDVDNGICWVKPVILCSHSSSLERGTIAWPQLSTNRVQRLLAASAQSKPLPQFYFYYLGSTYGMIHIQYAWGCSKNITMQIRSQFRNRSQEGRKRKRGKEAKQKSQDSRKGRSGKLRRPTGHLLCAQALSSIRSSNSKAPLPSL